MVERVAHPREEREGQGCRAKQHARRRENAAQRREYAAVPEAVRQKPDGHLQREGAEIVEQKELRPASRLRQISEQEERAGKVDQKMPRGIERETRIWFHGSPAF